jgi:hypothetical protein
MRLTPENANVATQGDLFPDSGEKRMTTPTISVRGFHQNDSLHKAA